MDAIESPEKRERSATCYEISRSPPVEMADQRGQTDLVAGRLLRQLERCTCPSPSAPGFRRAQAETVPEEGGSWKRYGNTQLALSHFKSKNQWVRFAEHVPSQARDGAGAWIARRQQRHAQVACPFHKKTFNLETGDMHL